MAVFAAAGWGACYAVYEASTLSMVQYGWLVVFDVVVGLHGFYAFNR